MAIATFHFAPLPGETHRAPQGGCWIQGGTVTTSGLRGFDAQQAPSPDPSNPQPQWATYQRPATFYPEGYWLPAGTTQYAVLYSGTTSEPGFPVSNRIIPFVPEQLQSSTVAALRTIQEANASRAARLLREALAYIAENGLGAEAAAAYLRANTIPENELAEYVRTRGLTRADLRLLERADENMLRPGEFYRDRPALVVFQVGASAAQRRRQVARLWADIELALRES